MQANRCPKVVAVNILHGPNHANIISHTPNVRKEITKLRTTLAIFFEIPT